MVNQTQSTSLPDLAMEGVKLCRGGNWDTGLLYLNRAMGSADGRLELEGLALSYFGYGIARYHRMFNEGIDLCKRSIDLQFYEPENYLNLARTYLLRDRYSFAIDVLRRGLKEHEDYRPLRLLYDQINRRRPPVVSFLRRSHPVNYFLGRLRHRVAGPKPVDANDPTLERARRQVIAEATGRTGPFAAHPSNR